jgi:hypothetical protein
MKKILLITLSFATLFTQAQDETVKKLQADASKTIAKNPADTVPKTWRKGGLVNLNVAQSSLSNWAAGGDKFSLTLNCISNLYAFYKKGKHSWDNTLDFNLGYIRTTSLGNRKNDDRLDLMSKYGYSIAPKWNIAALFDFRTQFFNGYTYTDTSKVFSSALLSPAYILLGLGFDYKPNNHFSLFLSPATARWIIVKDDSLAAKGAYGVDPGKHTKSEIGAFVSANYLTDLNKTISYKGRLDLFSNYKHNPGKIDVFMTNLLAVKLTRVLALTWNLDLIYDDDVRLFGKNHDAPAWQVKSLVGLGLLLKF